MDRTYLLSDKHPGRINLEEPFTITPDDHVDEVQIRLDQFDHHLMYPYSGTILTGDHAGKKCRAAFGARAERDREVRIYIE